jgi:hypothetical protein
VNLWTEKGIEIGTAIESGMFIADNDLISKLFFFTLVRIHWGHLGRFGSAYTGRGFQRHGWRI